MLNSGDPAQAPPASASERTLSVQDLGELITLACTRPPARRLSDGRRGDHQLPLLVLKVAGSAERDRVSDQIEQWCASTAPCPIPAVRCPAPDERAEGALPGGMATSGGLPPDENGGPGEDSPPAGDGPPGGSLRSELAAIRGGLREPAFGKLPRFRFPRSDLTELIMDFAARPGSGEMRRSLIKELARKDRLARAMRAAPGVRDTVENDSGSQPGSQLAGPAAWGKLAAFMADFIAVLAIPVLAWRLRTRLGFLGGPYYWFRKNINFSRGMEADTNFFSPVYFLSRLAGKSRGNFEDYASRQLTSAMLEDLQDSYRRGCSPWRGWARPVYPVLILDEVPQSSARARLLLQINHDRLEGRWDPLLVVAVVADHGSYAALRRSARADIAGTGVARGSLAGREPGELYRDWSSQFPGALRPAAPDGWFLFLSVEAGPRPGQRAAGGRPPGRRRPTRRRPLWTRIPAQAAAVVLAAALGCAGVATMHREQRRAQHARLAAFEQRFCAPGVSRLADGQCVGLAPPGFLFGMHDWTASLADGTAVRPGLRHVAGDLTATQLEQDISHANSTAGQQATGGRNAVATIVYIGPLSLTGDIDNPQTDGVRELAGVYFAQQSWNSTPENGVQNRPLIRILVANAGWSMVDQYQVAQQVIRLARSGVPVAGVVGVGMNEPNTPETVDALGQAGIPVVGTTNSMDTQYPLYFQLAPDDRREAQVGVDFLKTIRDPIHAVEMVDTTPGYTSELGGDVRDTLAHAGFRAMPVLYYDSPRSLPQLVDQACQDTGGKLNLIYYAGRGADLSWLITQGLGASAGCGENQITILSGDDVSKYAGLLPGNVTLDYTALTFPPAWQTCYHDSNLPLFYGSYLAWLQQHGISRLQADPVSDLLLTDGHTVLGYDAASVMANAAGQVLTGLDGSGTGLVPAGVQVTAGEVWGQLRVAGEPSGATGPISFQAGYEQDKFVPVIRRTQQAQPHVVFAAGTLDPGARRTCPGH